MSPTKTPWWIAPCALCVAALAACGPSKDEYDRLLKENTELRRGLGSAGASNTPPPTQASAVPPPAASSVALAPPDDAAPLGEPIVTKAYSITAFTAKACGPPDEKGDVLYGVDVLVEAHGERVTIASAEVQDDNSYSFPPVIPLLDSGCGPQLHAGVLEKGEKTRGFFHFVVPASAKGKTIKVALVLDLWKRYLARFKLDK